MKKNVLINRRVLCFAVLAIISLTVAFAAVYMDANGNLFYAPGPEGFESYEDWQDWCAEMCYYLLWPTK